MKRRNQDRPKTLLMVCSGCGEKFNAKTYQTLCQSCKAKPRTLSPERYRAALERIKAQIEAGSPLVAYDDTTPGDKELHCSWGLCSSKAEQWPDAEDHLWPHQFTTEGRVAPKDLLPGQICPMDDDLEHPTRERAPTGCFYRCQIFRLHLKESDRAFAVQLYQQALDLLDREP